MFFFFYSSLDNSQVIAKVSTFITQKLIQLEVNIRHLSYILFVLLKYLHYLKNAFSQFITLHSNNQKL